MAAAVRRVAGEAGAPVGVVLEGGYDLGALARSVAATLSVLAAADPSGNGEVALDPLTEEALARARALLAGAQDFRRMNVV